MGNILRKCSAERTGVTPFCSGVNRVDWGDRLFIGHYSSHSEAHIHVQMSRPWGDLDALHSYHKDGKPPLGQAAPAPQHAKQETGSDREQKRTGSDHERHSQPEYCADREETPEYPSSSDEDHAGSGTNSSGRMYRDGGDAPTLYFERHAL